MSCNVQRYWILLSNLCHGLLGGLALAHLLLVLTTSPFDWLSIATGSNEGESAAPRGSTLAHAYASTFYGLAVVCLVSVFDRYVILLDSRFLMPLSVVRFSDKMDSLS